MLDDGTRVMRRQSSKKTAAGAGESAVPSGAARVVRDWVGSDPARARRALEAEENQESPRSTLVKELRGLLGLTSDPSGGRAGVSAEEII